MFGVTKQFIDHLEKQIEALRREAKEREEKHDIERNAWAIERSRLEADQIQERQANQLKFNAYEDRLLMLLGIKPVHEPMPVDPMTGQELASTSTRAIDRAWEEDAKKEAWEIKQAEIEHLNHYELIYNDAEAAKQVVDVR